MALNITHSPKDGRHAAVLAKIDDAMETRVDSIAGGSAGSLEGVIAARASPKRIHFDLIGHAQDGVLILCDWLVKADKTATDVTTTWQQRVNPPRLGDVRLLGCNTAVTAQGIAAIRGLNRLWGISLKGTTQPIAAADFNENGFVSDGLTAEVTDATVPEPALEATRLRWFRRFKRPAQSFDDALRDLRRETLADVTREWRQYPARLRWDLRVTGAARATEIAARALDSVRRAPGLLAQPDYELLWPAPPTLGAPKFHRMTVLLGGAFVRIYTRAEPAGVIFCLGPDFDPRLRVIRRDSRPTD